MKTKLSVRQLREELVSGQLPQERPQLAIFLNWGLNLLLGLIMSQAVVLGSCGPFGISAVAQAGAGLGGFMCAVGASAGYLLCFGFRQGMRYVASAVLVFTAGYVSQGLKLSKKRWFMPLMAGAFTLLAGFLGAVETLNGSSDFLTVLTETILAGGGAYFFGEALSFAPRQSEGAELRRGIAVVILLACGMISLSRLRVLGAFSLGRLAALLIVMAAAFKGGALSGAGAGAVLGVAMDIASGASPCFSAAYAFSGLVSGVFSKHSRLIFIISFVLCNAACSVWVWSGGNVQAESLYECFAASVIFMLLPNSWLNYAGAFLRPAQLSSGESGLRRYTAGRISKMGDAFRDLYDTVDRQLCPEANDEDISKVFDRAADSVCGKCKNKSQCWTRDYMDTVTVFNDLSPVIESRGKISQNDLPGYFREKCLKCEELVTAVNGELRARLYRRQFRNRLIENRSAAYSQYADLSEILKQLSEELQNAFGPDSLSQRRLDRYLSGMDIDADISAFRDRSGRLHIILESARLESLTRKSGYLDELSGVVGVRLCRPKTGEEAQGRLLLLEAEPLSASVGIATMKKKGEPVSGDRGTYFKTDGGQLCVILSDGMGSGEDAARESVAAVRILERFLRSGVEPEVAMRMLNSMMLLKNGEEWGFATVDLMCIDLFSGETAFYKYGAAPSYVKSGRTVRRVRSESLAAGLTSGEGSAPDMVKMRLKPGCVALIASDGVIAGTNDEWLRQTLTDSQDAEPKALARQTLETALRQYGCTDDMTVLAVKIDSRV